MTFSSCFFTTFRSSKSELEVMDTAAPLLAEFLTLLQAELTSISSANRRAFIEALLVESFQTSLNWEYGSDEPYDAWVFADLGKRRVIAMYCRGGFGALGSPWGINFRDAAHFGQDSGWYPTVEALIEDWGIPA